MKRFLHLTILLGFLLPVLSTRTHGQEPGSIILHWRMDEPAGDKMTDALTISKNQPSGNNYGLILDDPSPDWLPSGGVSRGAYHFDGSASVKLEGYAGSGKSLSLAMWIRPAAFQNSMLAQKMDEGVTGKGWALLLRPDGAVEFRIGSARNYTSAVAEHAYTPGQWTQLTAVYDGPGKKEKFRSIATLAVDGMVSAVACEIPQSPSADKARLTLGASLPPTPANPLPAAQGHYAGDVDRFLFWAKALKRKDMAALADFHEPTIISLVQQEEGNFLDWKLAGVDADAEDDFDFALVPATGGGERGGAAIHGNLLSLESLPPAGMSFYITVRANDGTGRSVDRQFTFTTPPKPTDGGSEDPDDPVWDGGPKLPDNGGSENGQNGGNNGHQNGADGEGKVSLPLEESPPVLTPPALIQQWSPLAVPAGATVGSVSSFLIQRDVRPTPVRTFALVSGFGDQDNALFSLKPGGIPNRPDEVALTAAAPLEMHDGRVFHVLIRASAQVGTRSLQSDIALTFSALRLQINEFLADNEFELQDEDGDTSDWIEILNTGSHPTRLENWCLTNDPRRPDRWQAPGVLLPGGEFHVFFASKKGVVSPETAARPRPNHTNFTLKKEEGEYLGLYAPDGATVLSEFTFLPAQKSDDSYGCFHDNPATRGLLAEVTPGFTNGDPAVPVIPPMEPLVLTPPHGFYGTSVPVTLSCGTAGVSIYYTLDGSLPTPEKGRLYTGSLTLTTSSSLRARAFATGRTPSDMVTANYILPDSVPRESTMGPANSGEVAAAIRSLPALAITMVPENLAALGADIAQPVELEWLPRPAAIPGTGGMAEDDLEFQRGATIQISGQSRLGVSPKSAYRLIFEDHLKAPLFGRDGGQEFKEIALRTAFQNSWLSPEAAERPRGQEIRDEFVRRLHGRMGHPAPIGNFVHLFINGQYAGLFNPAEVPGDVWQFSHGGCTDDDFDTLKEGLVKDDESTRALTDWDEADAYARSEPVTAPDYLNVLGEKIDLDSFIDMILLRAYVGDRGFELWSGPDMSRQHNGYAGREWVNKKPFQFFAWDGESSLESETFDAFASSNHSTLFEKLITHPDFKTRVIARVQRHFYGGGALAGNTPRDLYAALAAGIEAAIPAEAARWGNKNPLGGSYGLADWRAERDRLLGVWFPARREALLAQLTAMGLNVQIAWPALNLPAGWHPAGSTLTATSEPGTLIYYTAESDEFPPVADPRSAGGSVSLQAKLWTGALVLEANTVLTFRAWKAGVWSPTLQVAYRIGPQRPTLQNFIVSEIMYHGAMAGKANFIEFHNPSVEQVDLTGLVLADGVRFDGGTKARILEPGAYALLVEDGVTFKDIYGSGLPVWGQWTGALKQEGESIVVTLPRSEFADGQRFSFSSGRNWPQDAALKPYSLVPRDPAAWAGEDEPEAWRASHSALGSPGMEDLPGPVQPLVVINEVLTNGLLTQVELLNRSESAGDISGWILAPPDLSRNADLSRAIPAGTIIAPGGYLMVEIPSSLVRNFARLELTAMSLTGTPGGYVDSLALYPIADGVSQGPYLAHDGSRDTAPLAAFTPGAANLWPRVPQVVISEIRYHPGDEEAPSPTGLELDWIEILNRGAVPVNLAGYSLPQWNFAFPDQTLPPQGMALVIASADARAFRQHWQVPQDVPIFTAPAVQLANSGPFVVLARAAPDGSGSGYTEWVAVSDEAPWPESADGEGRSLERFRMDEFANDSAVWRASYQDGGSPGQVRANSFRSWQQAQFSPDELLKSLTIAPTGDPDRDDRNNLAEYAFGGDPHQINPPTAVTLKTTLPAGGVDITFPRRSPGYSSAAYDLEVSNGLGGWRNVTTHCALVSRVPLTDGLEEATFRYTGPETALPRCFLRIVSRLTPP